VTDERPSRRILPPVWTVGFLVAEFALHRWLPVAVWLPRPWSYLGALVLLGGISLLIWALALFRRAKTGLIPFSDATELVVAGPYRFTRNPMYLGMTSVLLGVALLLGTVTPLAAPAAFATIITLRFIVHEEVQMERTFGAAYLDFKKRVRRWL
jgi:protein-S-isoprenylcysteine O-methyltransferase Ste14